ncbi:hypothetical protein WN55_11287 [Dufourea novaeangliae]|uniref:Uncharacterized protein n=1 Tax=Dufourea novaeangliae TaxID=178035 RepID=A0A154PBK3_DUFNO|nr:hypothetical protein WN55_11287 [Dufourea novaeangliae]
MTNIFGHLLLVIGLIAMAIYAAPQSEIVPTFHPRKYHILVICCAPIRRCPPGQKMDAANKCRKIVQD